MLALVCADSVDPLEGSVGQYTEIINTCLVIFLYVLGLLIYFLSEAEA